MRRLLIFPASVFKARWPIWRLKSGQNRFGAVRRGRPCLARRRTQSAGKTAFILMPSRAPAWARDWRTVSPRAKIDELEKLALSIDWQEALSDSPAREDIPFRRKR